ncbi:HAD-IA family hydrolase [Rhodococcus triatomae]|uniref:Sugar-phosphatase n=1 Tax=Rhodococcus triatomae TaxID=300028 RepID=A0A1G8GAC1_9NOCA|nr:HAD-IA family hydrolase [Rhodococcus triatomae]QNG20443.1 HAD-IA family hydrolase [Rhodococcus triatomae]QNG23641.1 HAD-IA family hydrolase [Rhodococcus triatomae]SDH91324.1 sugar-phosphatase [Rhodococcus triatomae]
MRLVDATGAEAVTVQALLFDMDGTLVDSAMSIERVWLAFARRHVLDPVAVLTALPGRTAPDIVAGLLGPEADVDAEVRWVRECESGRVDGIRAIRGAARLLAALPAQRWAIVTSATRTMMELRLEAAGLPLPAFAVCAEDVRAGKPDPEGFLSAARMLGADPGECLAFEDSTAGLEAIARAGASAVAVGATYPGARAVADLSRISVWPRENRVVVEFGT